MGYRTFCSLQLATLKAERLLRGGNRISECLRLMQEKYPLGPAFGYQGAENDRLFEAQDDHVAERPGAMCAIRQAKCNAPSLSSEISKYGVKSSTATLIVESQPGVGHVTYIGLVPGGRTIKDLVIILKMTKRTSKTKQVLSKLGPGEYFTCFESHRLQGKSRPGYQAQLARY
jgi:hypothetical protein